MQLKNAKGKGLLPAPDLRSLVSEVLIIRYFPEVESPTIEYIHLHNVIDRISVDGMHMTPRGSSRANTR